MASLLIEFDYRKRKIILERVTLGRFEFHLRNPIYEGEKMEVKLERDYGQLPIILRIVSISLGIIIFMYHYSLYAPSIHSEYYSFWYYTNSSQINLLVAIWIIFVVVGLILYPIYQPNTKLRIFLGYLGIAIFSIGSALTVNVSWMPAISDTILEGYAIAFIGGLVIGEAYQIRKKIRSLKEYMFPEGI